MAKRFLAKITINALDGTGEEIRTEVKATGMDQLKRKLLGIIELMDDEDGEAADDGGIGGTRVTR